MLTKRVCGMFPKAQNDNHQITDLLQLSRWEKECRVYCLHTMRRRKEWRKAYGNPDHSKIMIYAKIEGLLLKRQVQDAIFFYRVVKNDRVVAFREYMGKLPQRGSQQGAVR